MELLVSVAVMSVIMVGLGSAILLASHALPDGDSPLDAMLEAGTITGHITADLRYATSFSERSLNAVEFTVPDRNHGDVGPEVIRYEWSGTAGDPLIRMYNNGEGTTVADDVYEFQIKYHLGAIDTEETSENESAVTVLVNHTATGSINNYAVHSNHWIGAYFRPELPPEAVSWKVTDVRFRARVRDEALGLTMVQLRLATSDHRPDVTVLEEVPMYESTLTASYLMGCVLFLVEILDERPHI